ncbi:MAG: Gfo/Idh/MocA family protein [Planctomycetota bacterium]
MSIGIGVIGYGYWGPNLVRNFVECPHTTVKVVSDTRAPRLEAMQRRFPGVRGTTDAAELINAPDVDAVVIATPVSTHFPLGMAALEAGKHVLMEKPLAESYANSRQLVDTAREQNRVLLVDHTFVYTPVVRRMKQLISGGDVGEVYYFDSTRVNLGLFQNDVSVLWDLAVHDLAVLDYLFAEHRPVAVSATGAAHIPGHPVNTAWLTVYTSSSFLAHIHVNWLSPTKLRRTIVGGSKSMLVWDDLDPAEKLRVYDKGVDVRSEEETHKRLIGYRSGDMHAPHIGVGEALAVEAVHFADCIEGKATPETPGEAGLTVVAVLEAAEQSMNQRGTPVELQ